MKKLIWLLCLCVTSVYATDFGDIPANTDVSTLWVPPARTLTIGGTAQNLSTNRTWTTNTILEGLGSPAQGDIIYRGSANWVLLNASTDGKVLTTHGASANPTWTTPTTVTPAALSKADDTNVTLTLTGTPTTALLQATTITAGWSGQLALGRGGTAANLSDPGANVLWGWDDTDNAIKFITIGTGLAYDHASHTVSATAQAQSHSISFIVDGAGGVLSTGTKNPIKIPFGGTLTGWLLIAKPSGSVTVDILRSADGAGLPVTSIVGGGGTKPALSSAVEGSSTSFTSWTSTTLTAKDNLAISLSGIATSTYVALTLYYQ